VRVVVGRIGRPHGIRGAVTVEPRTDEPDERFAPDSVLLPQSGASPLVVRHSQWHSGRLLVEFDGVDDRNEAEALRGTILEVERQDDARPDDPEEFYDSALLGCAVITVAGETLGEVTEVAHLPAQDLLVVAGEGREVLVPFVSEIVPSVDLAARVITVDPPEGLLDIEES